MTDQPAYGMASPGYNPGGQYGAVISAPQQRGIQVIQPMTGGPTVVVSFFLCPFLVVFVLKT